eukprot:Lankesteria_metandrocarpae@DN3716_c0_g1_i2.p1
MARGPRVLSTDHSPVTHHSAILLSKYEMLIEILSGEIQFLRVELEKYKSMSATAYNTTTTAAAIAVQQQRVQGVLRCNTERLLPVNHSCHTGGSGCGSSEVASVAQSRNKEVGHGAKRAVGAPRSGQCGVRGSCSATAVQRVYNRDAASGLVSGRKEVYRCNERTVDGDEWPVQRGGGGTATATAEAAGMGYHICISCHHNIGGDAKTRLLQKALAELFEDNRTLREALFIRTQKMDKK